MGIEEGTILVKNSIENDYTRQFGMSEGDKFKFIKGTSRINDTISVTFLKNGITYVMYAHHFMNERGEFTKDCMWR